MMPQQCEFYFEVKALQFLNRIAERGMLTFAGDDPLWDAGVRDPRQRLRSRPGRYPPFFTHPGGNPEANLKSISRRCYLREVAFE